MRQDLEAVAQRNDIHDYKSLIDTVSNALEKFRDYAVKLNISQQIIESIQSDFVRV